ncbi:proline-rich transmembrane protein 4-like [Latimeria chalumnae]|uniref:proline-rich transmembrane protein 4-like n=1 Tax=Latimeria chalumnae TaxID=7897 RepID=UPI00313EFF1B
MAQVLQAMGVKHHLHIPYRPQASDQNIIITIDIRLRFKLIPKSYRTGVILAVVFLNQLSFLFFMSQGVFVILATLLLVAFFIFYCHVKSDTMHIYDLKCSTPPTDNLNRCPFADFRDWSRAAKTTIVSAVFGLFCAGLQLYAMLHALGFSGIGVFNPWPWWAFQLGLRLCEVGMSLPLALVGVYPLFCSNEAPKRNCWSKIISLSSTHTAMKAPILPNNYQWASSHHEKLVICDIIARSDSECLPLYTLVGKSLSSGEDVVLLSHTNRGIEAKDLDLNLKYSSGSKAPSFISVQMDSDSTVDLRPPSPINLRRSIDEALFSEALIPESLFQDTKLYSSSNLSLNVRSPVENAKEKNADRGLYRTSSCVEMEIVQVKREFTASSSNLSTTVSSPGRWRGSSASSFYKLSQDGSSLVLCSSPEKLDCPSSSAEKRSFRNSSQMSLCRVSQAQRQYRALSPPSQESVDIVGHPDLVLQAEFIDVCKQIDELSVSSETIDL